MGIAAGFVAGLLIGASCGVVATERILRLLRIGQREPVPSEVQEAAQVVSIVQSVASLDPPALSADAVLDQEWARVSEFGVTSPHSHPLQEVE